MATFPQICVILSMLSFVFACVSTVKVLITTCCTLGVCVSPDSHVGILTPSVMVLEVMRVGSS